MKQLILMLSLSFLCFQLYAQEAETILLSGKITEKKTGEDAIGAYVKIFKNGKEIASTATDFEGNYSLQLPKGFYDVEVSYVGFKTKLVKNVIAFFDFSLDVKLEFNEKISYLSHGCGGYKIPLVQQDCSSSSAAYSSEEIARMPK